MPDGVLVWGLLCLSAFVAGAVNSLAGGGTLLTFPVLLSIPGISSVQANATSTFALMPGSAAAARAYRRELKGASSWLLVLSPPSLLGGLIGTVLVVWMPERVFDLAVPWLLLTASLLFMFQPLFSSLVLVRTRRADALKRTGADPELEEDSGFPAAAGTGTWLAVVTFQLAVAVYGGYFGAGIGILMLTALAFICPGDIHRMNALKTFLAACINGVSVLVFIVEGKVIWRYGLAMSVAGIAGGFCGAYFGRQLPRSAVRWFVIVIGLAITAYQFARQSAPAPVEPSRAPAVSVIED